MTEPKLWKSKPTLPLALAETIVDAALAAAREHGMEPLTVAVLDAGGHLVALKREDGSGILRVQVATGKAWGALGMGASSRLLRDRLGNRPAFIAALTDASEGRFVPAPGGVLVLDTDASVLGAVGVSGDTSECDEYCAIQGIKAAGLACHPAEPDPDWQAAVL